MIRDFTVRAVLNGYVVNIGCQTLVFNNPAALCDEIERYLRNPQAVEKEYLNASLNAKHTSPLNAPMPDISRLGNLETQCETERPSPRRDTDCGAGMSAASISCDRRG